MKKKRRRGMAVRDRARERGARERADIGIKRGQTKCVVGRELQRARSGGPGRDLPVCWPCPAATVRRVQPGPARPGPARPGSVRPSARSGACSRRNRSRYCQACRAASTGSARPAAAAAAEKAGGGAAERRSGRRVAAFRAADSAECAAAGGRSIGGARRLRGLVSPRNFRAQPEEQPLSE